MSISVAYRVQKIIVEHMDVDPARVTDSAAFIDDLGADSLDYIDLLMTFEEEFDIEITDEEAEKVQTVGDAIRGIADKLGEPVS